MNSAEINGRTLYFQITASKETVNYKCKYSLLLTVNILLFSKF